MFFANFLACNKNHFFFMMEIQATAQDFK